MQRMQREKGFLARLGLFILIYLLLATVMYWVVKESWSTAWIKTDSVSMGYLLPAGSRVRQSVSINMDGVETVEFVPHFDQQQRNGDVSLRLLEGENIVWSSDIPAKDLPTDQNYQVKIDPAVQSLRGTIALEIEPNNTGMALWAGNTVNTGKFDVNVQTPGMLVNGKEEQGSLVLSVYGYIHLQGRRWFWPVAVLLLMVITVLAFLTHSYQRKGKQTVFTMTVAVYIRYRYLLKQLVERDFRVKYKSSMLGMAWSLLNPLLTMLVYLFVFSTLFKSDIKNFPVYLMSGIILFSYFSEATNVGMTSIVGNNALITKVYMPKMIYPLSKVLSSAINFCISLIPLFLVMMITGVALHKSILLMPVVIGFLVVFTFGMSLILSTMHVFFRDTQFLWSVVLTMLNFLTPIFYPESIIPVQFQRIYHMNPMYQIIFFMRTIIIDGVSPAPVTYLYCILSCGITLLLGLWIFRKNQDRFVLYL